MAKPQASAWGNLKKLSSLGEALYDIVIIFAHRTYHPNLQMKLFKLIFLLRFRQVFEQVLSLEEGMMRAS